MKISTRITPIRKSVPTLGVHRWWAHKWLYIMPDFDVKDHSIVEWIGTGEPREPADAPLKTDMVES